MKSKGTTAITVGSRLLAPWCLYGARTACTYLEALTAALEGVRRAEDNEFVHDMRVASRRLGSILPLLTLCLRRKTCHRWQKQLRHLTRGLGKARDTDVQITCVQHFLGQEASAQECPGVERLLRLQQRRQTLQESILEAVEQFVASRLIEEMEPTLT